MNGEKAMITAEAFNQKTPFAEPIRNFINSPYPHPYYITFFNVDKVILLLRLLAYAHASQIQQISLGVLVYKVPNVS